MRGCGVGKDSLCGVCGVHKNERVSVLKLKQEAFEKEAFGDGVYRHPEPTSNPVDLSLGAVDGGTLHCTAANNDIKVLRYRTSPSVFEAQPGAAAAGP